MKGHVRNQAIDETQIIHGATWRPTPGVPMGGISVFSAFGMYHDKIYRIRKGAKICIPHLFPGIAGVSM